MTRKHTGRAASKAALLEEEQAFYEKIGFRLRYLRIERGLKKEDLGRALGVSGQQIRTYENGKSRFRLWQFLAYCRTLDADACEILKDLY